MLLRDAVTPPRRYSIESWNAPEFLGPRLRIFLDGVEQKEVVEYDCDKGIVLKNKLGADGQTMLNAKRDEIVRETVTGNVTVEWRD